MIKGSILILYSPLLGFMEQQTVTNINNSFKSVYFVQNFDQSKLLNISKFKDTKVVAIDSCGFHYENKFYPIVKIENLQTAKEYRFQRSAYDQLFNRVENINETADVLLLDHCPKLFKYKTLEELAQVLSILTSNIKPKHCLIRMSLVTLNDNRLTDRFKNLVSIVPDSYVVETAAYDCDHFTLSLLKREKI
jgi:hypothetical protein